MGCKHECEGAERKRQDTPQKTFQMFEEGAREESLGVPSNFEGRTSNAGEISSIFKIEASRVRFLELEGTSPF